MAINAPGDKRRGARTGRVKVDHGPAFAPGDVPKFAPHFSVYVLPPDTVCLYSEDRKFFLHGELYCALASAIGSGKRAQDVARALKRDYPGDKVDEAFGRLLERRFVVRMRAGDGTVAAYWASLGLP